MRIINDADCFKRFAAGRNMSLTASAAKVGDKIGWKRVLDSADLVSLVLHHQKTIPGL